MTRPTQPAALALTILILATGTTVRAAEGDPDRANGGAADVPGPSGILIPEQEDGRGAGIRSALVVPQTVVRGLVAPVRAGFVLYEEHHIRERVLDLFFDDTRTFGIYPRLSLETETQLGIGLRMVHRDLFGRGLRLQTGADWGGEYQQRIDGSLDTPRFAGDWLRVSLRGGWQRQPRAPFHGIGDPVDPASTLDPTRPWTTPAAHPFRQRVSRGQLGLGVLPGAPFFGSVDLTFVSRRFGQAASPAGAEPDALFDLAALPGWRRGTDVFYLEARFGFDTRIARSPRLPASAPSTGTRVELFGGAARGVDGDPTRYFRYGGEARRLFDLYGGDRVLTLRARAEGVVAAGSEAQIPFTDLPRLGGPQELRGYTRDRFRDRLAVLGTVEYRYPIWRELAGYLVVDVGRVLPGADELPALLRSPSRLRVGGGGGLELHTRNRFTLRTQIAGSSEGVFLQMVFEPDTRIPSPAYRI